MLVFAFFSGPENNYGYAFNTGYGQQPIATNDVSTVLIKNLKVLNILLLLVL